MKDKAVNAGVTAQTGFELQRNCALLLLLENYDFYKDKDFFLCIEHQDDFLFAFTTDNHKTLLKVETYQSKKKSGAVWKINADFGEVITKILGVGTTLRKDNMPKSKIYGHVLTFISNTGMSLEYNPTKKMQSSGEKPESCHINEQNEKQVFKDLPQSIQDRFNTQVKKHCQNKLIKVDETEFDNLSFQWIDFPKTAHKQKEALIGLMHTKFPHVVDSKASIELFIELFKRVEQIYNQKDIASLLDESKRLYGHDLKKTLDIIQVEQKTYEKWRNNAETFAPAFKIPLLVQESAKDKIRETFEYLKDLTNLDHMKIQKFIQDNDYRLNYFSLVEMIKGYISEIKKSEHINLNDIDIFFTCLCAYMEFYDEGNL